MSREEESINQLGRNSSNHDFSRQDEILNFRPKIEFVEPEQEHYSDIPIEKTPETIDSYRDRTRDLIKGYKAAKKLAKQVQQRIDQRVSSAGGIDIKLDPAKDAATISALKRVFPDKKDFNKISYNDYRKCLECISKSAPENPTVKNSDIKAAKSDATKTDFGGLSNQSGENRAEISSPASSVSPVDLSALQAALVIALFGALLPMIKLEDKAEVAQHLATIPHT